MTESSQRLIIEKLKQVELAAPVNELRVGEVCVWPLIRLYLWKQLLHPGKEVLYQPHSLKQKLRSTCNFDLSVIDQLPKSAQGLDYLCFVKDGEESEILASKTYNRHIDPLLELLPGNLKAQKFCHAAPTGPSTFSSLVIPLKKKSELGNEESFVIEGYGKFQREAEKILGFGVPMDFWLCKIRYLQYLHEFYVQLLQKLQPKLVTMVCFYHEQGMALSWAARDLGIPAVDLQHGQQGKLHGMYTHWSKLPKEGYQLLPKIFWTWGKTSAANLEKHLVQPGAFHQVKVGGQPWLAKHQRPRVKKVPKKACPEVLVSLQPIAGPLLAPEILQAIEKTPHWKWRLRLHPQQKDAQESLEKLLEERGKLLEERGLKHVEFQESTSRPLYSLLQQVDAHVTAYSTVAIEALAFGVKSAIYHPTGWDLFSDYFEKKIFYRTHDDLSLIQSLERCFSESINSFSAFCLDPGQIREAFLDLR